MVIVCSLQFLHRFHGAVAQLVEQRPLKATVPGSTPGCPTMKNTDLILFDEIDYAFLPGKW